jgi:hypothetical protein
MEALLRAGGPSQQGAQQQWRWRSSAAEHEQPADQIHAPAITSATLFSRWDTHRAALFVQQTACVCIGCYSAAVAVCMHPSAHAGPVTEAVNRPHEGGVT